MLELDNLIDLVHRSHLDNAKFLYSSKDIESNRNTSSLVSPLTNFVFEYFLFNSIYAIDWEKSFETARVQQWDRSDMNELKQQRLFLKFCREKCKGLTSSEVSDVFLPLVGLGEASSEWRSVVSDSRISTEEGNQFFRKFDTLCNQATDGSMSASTRSFDLIKQCCVFIYHVRNNIFHGSKTLGQVYEDGQVWRIGVYDLFIRCVNGLFFRSLGKDDFGSQHAQFPMTLAARHPERGLSLKKVYELLNRGYIKSEDSYLYWRLFASHENPQSGGNPCGALFYPSAGRDILFPLIAGLRICTDFYFYEAGERTSRMPVRGVLQMLGVVATQVETDRQNARCFRFEFDSIERRIWFVNDDNMAFLSEPIHLRFLFRRGDSMGEGGSGQNWDIDLLPRLLEMVPAEHELTILTDGEPIRTHERIDDRLTRISPANSHRGRDYFFGTIGRRLTSKS